MALFLGSAREGCLTVEQRTFRTHSSWTRPTSQSCKRPWKGFVAKKVIPVNATGLLESSLWSRGSAEKWSVRSRESSERNLRGGKLLDDADESISKTKKQIVSAEKRLSVAGSRVMKTRGCCLAGAGSRIRMGEAYRRIVEPSQEVLDYCVLVSSTRVFPKSQ